MKFQYSIYLALLLAARVGAYDDASLFITDVVVITPSGKVMGKSRKNHIPRVGDFNEVITMSL